MGVAETRTAKEKTKTNKEKTKTKSNKDWEHKDLYTQGNGPTRLETIKTTSDYKRGKGNRSNFKIKVQGQNQVTNTVPEITKNIIGIITMPNEARVKQPKRDDVKQ